MNKSNIAILVGVIIVAVYILNMNKKEQMEVEQKDGKEIKEIKDKEEGGWWSNVINCKKNGDNNLYCKPKEKWIFPY
jgi:hypothetical protein